MTKKKSPQKSRQQNPIAKLHQKTVCHNCSALSFLWFYSFHLALHACYPYKSEHYHRSPIKCNENWTKLL